MKCQIAVYLDLDEIELLGELKTRYHHRSISQTLEFIIKQYQMLLEQRIKEQQTIKKESKKPVNPMVNL
jgi:hypothetical protein